MGGYSRFKRFHALDRRLSFMFLARTNGEIPYVEVLGAIPANRLTQWRGQDLFAIDVYVFERRQLNAEFWYVRKTGVYCEFIRNERRYRSKMG